jgi:hypothetical protein
VRNVLLSTLVDKWNFVPEGKSDFFSIETAFIQEHVLVPVNEFLTDHDMSNIVTELNSF